MISFILSLAALILGYFFYGRFVERVFGPDDRETPAVSKKDGLDYIALPGWKVYTIQFLNIAGTGPIFGGIMGAKFGPVAYLWIVLGCIFAGAVHDYLNGMLSMRNGGAGMPELIGKYLGDKTRKVMLLLTVFPLVIAGTVFVYSPAVILHTLGGDVMMWVAIIFVYYVIAAMTPIDKIIGKVYPLFAISLLLTAGALMVMLFVKMPQLPEIWSNLHNMGASANPGKFTDHIFPALFITIACGAISGFHGTQTPMMARCLASERMGRRVFYGAMITEGVVALVCATVSMWFFYAGPPGYEQISGAKDGFFTSAPMVVHLVCNEWLGVVGAVLAVLGVVAAPISSGDTAFRSGRLIVADWLKIDQRPIRNRLYICVPMFATSIAILVWQIKVPDGFNTIWQYFGFFNQTLSVFTLWAITVYLVQERKNFWVSLIPALFMTTVCTTYFFVSRQTLHLPDCIGYPLGLVCLAVACVWFTMWYRKVRRDK